MKIMLIEDDEGKRRAIVLHLKSRGIDEKRIVHVRSMTDFSASLHDDIGLFIIDLNLPSLDQSAASQNGMAILEAIVKAGKNDALMLAISSYPKDFPQLRFHFEARGCILADYAEKKSWHSTLDHLLIQLNKSAKFDFLVFCALREERNPYVGLANGVQVIRGGVDCFEFDLARKRGAVVLMPQMGLVNAAITAAICIDRFKPEVVGMSGICGGFSPRVRLGQLIFSSMAYEYQSGKWATDGFRQEPYQVATDHETLIWLKTLADKEGLIGQLEEGFEGVRPQSTVAPAPGVFTSGSAVIAEKKYLKQIEEIHRKVSALDMEVFAIQRASELSTSKPDCICAKTVVDLCDQNKGDDLHDYGSYISARFMLLALKDYFARKQPSRLGAV